MSVKPEAQSSTPLMKQYWEIKSLYPEPVVLFRMGDFYEMFFDDARRAAPVIGIALTQRNKKSAEETPMCGVPYHSIAGPIRKLLAAGYKVAICDQMEDPKQAKGIVKRAVTRVLTPGMVYDLDSLDGGKPHYLASVDGASASFLDTTTGEAFWIPVADGKELQRYIEILSIAELVVSPIFVATGFQVPVSIHDGLAADSLLLPPEAPESSARLLDYVKTLSGGGLLQIVQPFFERKLAARLHLSSTVLRHLEIFQTYRGEGEGSLFHAIDRTKTSAGARLLRQWLSFPLMDVEQIRGRQEGIESWKRRPSELKRIREILANMGDLERRLGKIQLPTCNARDLASLGHSLQIAHGALDFAGHSALKYPELTAYAHRVEQTLVEEPPLAVRQGYLIRKGVRADLDELIELSTDAQSLLARMEAEEKEKTGISSLKIRYNSVFGYYIEITNTHKDRVPARYQRKQTLANAERYCTDELIELERKVLSAQTRRAELEFEIYEDLRKQALAEGAKIIELARICSDLDVVTALAWLSLERKYVRPVFAEKQGFHLQGSRHPVVEQTVKQNFIPNDISLSPKDCLLLTGPNMAGKSTLMRQVALTVLLAQMGSDVPASRAELPIFDAIYTRIGASDQLSEGLSTFMVEMTETAAMLKSATEKSLVILDEVGRGTSTYDGMCLAQSILEHLLSHVRCLTLFATHYHELTGLSGAWPQIRNAHMTVSERGGEIRFLHTLVSGPALKSYGVQVAELAGLPLAVTKRAHALLKQIESRGGQRSNFDQLSLLEAPAAIAPEAHFADSRQEQQMQRMADFVKEIRDLELPRMTPLEALNKIASLQKSCPELS